MFGYVRPAKPELKVREWEAYQAAYCGLCHTLKKRYGVIPTFFLNYDFTFLAMLLSPGGQVPKTEKKRCIACPHKKKCVLSGNEGLDVAADESVILTYHQLRDAVLDKGFWKGTAARGLSLLLKPAYRKAAGLRPEFDRVVRENLERLASLEKEHSPSLDAPADTFAEILRAAAPPRGDALHDRSMEQLLYHVGRWIYLVDAWDDLQSDRENGNYNPLLYRWGDEPEAHEEEFRITLSNSINLSISAFNLLEFGCWEPILGNILCIGLPAVEEAVFRGIWNKKHNNLPQEIDRHERSL